MGYCLVNVFTFLIRVYVPVPVRFSPCGYGDITLAKQQISALHFSSWNVVMRVQCSVWAEMCSQYVTVSITNAVTRRVNVINLEGLGR